MPRVADRVGQTADPLACAASEHQALVDDLRTLFARAYRSRSRDLDLAQNRLDLRRGRLRLLREVPDVIGHDREAAAVLACASGFHTCVQRNRFERSASSLTVAVMSPICWVRVGQVDDLLRDAVDASADLVHRLGDRLQGLCSLVAHLDRVARPPGDVLGSLRHLVGRGAQAVDGAVVRLIAADCWLARSECSLADARICVVEAPIS